VFGAKGMVEHVLEPNSDLTRYAWAAFGDASSTGRASKWLKEHGINENRVVYRVNTLLGLAEAVAGGVGLALLPCFIGHALPMLAQLTPPLPEVQGELWLLTHPDLRNTARVRTFLEFCASEFAHRRAIIEGKAPA
jgi:DNA-binding transcriptional LysR family regulator